MNYDPSPRGFQEIKRSKNHRESSGQYIPQPEKSRLSNEFQGFATVRFGLAASWFVCQPKSLFAQGL